MTERVPEPPDGDERGILIGWLAFHRNAVKPGGYDFRHSCRRHDFGYQNMQRGETYYPVDMWRNGNKAVADMQFKRDMATECDNYRWLNRAACYGWRKLYYNSFCHHMEPDTCGNYVYTYKLY